MLDGREDQATGLRRLFRRSPPSVVAFFVCGKDARGLAGRAMVAMARGAHRLAVLDEARGEAALAPHFGLPERGDLLNLIDGRTQIDSLVQEVGPGLYHLTVAGAALALPLLDEDHRERVLDGLHEMQRHCQLILIHGGATDLVQPSPFLLAAPGRLLVVEASARGVNDSFALIRRLAGAGAGDLSIAVTGARDRADARRLFAELEVLVGRRIGLPLRFLGEIERDDIAGLLQEHSPQRREREASAAFMRRLTAWTRNRIGAQGTRA